jgi:hypothetical protein
MSSASSLQSKIDQLIKRQCSRHTHAGINNVLYCSWAVIHCPRDYTVPQATDDFIVNNEKEKAFILWNEKFHSIG